MVLQPATKKQKCQFTSLTGRELRPVATTKRKAGKLSMLPSLSLDILFEIFSHLRPLDILHLARTTKIFRGTLMSRRASLIWKKARANVPGLPDCPLDLTEPEYANLAFDRHCHICGKNGIRSVDWLLRVRYCPKCAKETFKTCSTIPKVSFKFTECFYPSSLPKYARCYSLDLILTTEAKIRALDHDEDAQEAFKELKKRQRECVFEHARLCFKWANQCFQDRSDEIREAKDSRANSILQRLRDLGWGDELQLLPPDAFHEHPLVKPSVPLTERIWANIQPSLLEWMHDMKARRLRCERKKFAVITLRQFKASLPGRPNLFLPGPADVCNFPDFKDIIELPNDASVNQSTFTALLSRLSPLIVQWHRQIKLQLADLASPPDTWPRTTSAFKQATPTVTQQMNEDRTEPTEEEKFAKLNLATTVFQCNVCGLGRYPNTFDRHTAHFPWIMAHPCLVWEDDREVSPNDVYHPDVSTDLYQHHTKRRRPWTCDLIWDDECGQKLIAPIVKGCGLDPEVATTRQMDQLDARLVCLTCTQGRRCDGKMETDVYTWRTAAAHGYQHTLYTKAPLLSWECLSDADAQEARRLESERLSNDAGSTDNANGHLDIKSCRAEWSCVHCEDTIYEELIPHWRKKDHMATHGKNQVLPTDFYRHLSVLPPSPGVVKMVPGSGW